jgi:hypothetical protein
MAEGLVDILGWTGSILVLVAFGLNIYEKIKPDSWAYIFLNLAGGILLIIYSIYKGAYANTFINVAWVVVAVSTIFKIVFRKQKG